MKMESTNNKRYCVNCGVVYVPPLNLCRSCIADPALPRETISAFLYSIAQKPMTSIKELRLIYPGEHASFALAAIITIVAFLLLSTITLGLFLLYTLIGIMFLRIRQARTKLTMPRVSERNFHDLDNIVGLACYRLRMPRPSVYVQQDPTLNAYAAGFWDSHWLVIHSGLLEELEPEEMLFVVGHELGHVRHGHTSLLNLIAPGSGHPIPLVSTFLDGIFKAWSRRAEYTADRSGLVACRDPHAASMALLKLVVGPAGPSQISLEEYLRQYKEHSDDPLSKIAELLGTHPFIPNRIMAIQKYFASRAYGQIVAEGGKPA